MLKCQYLFNKIKNNGTYYFYLKIYIYENSPKVIRLFPFNVNLPKTSTKCLNDSRVSETSKWHLRQLTYKQIDYLLIGNGLSYHDKLFEKF